MRLKCKIKHPKYQGERHHFRHLDQDVAKLSKITNSEYRSLLRDEGIVQSGAETRGIMYLKIFRLRTTPRKKMDASAGKVRLIAPEFAKTSPADCPEDPEDDALFELICSILDYVKLHLLFVVLPINLKCVVGYLVYHL